MFFNNNWLKWEVGWELSFSLHKFGINFWRVKCEEQTRYNFIAYEKKLSYHNFLKSLSLFYRIKYNDSINNSIMCVYKVFLLQINFKYISFWHNLYIRLSESWFYARSKCSCMIELLTRIVRSTNPTILAK